MKDLEIKLSHRPGALAEMGELLGKANISLEGGGMFTVGDVAIAHFLVDEPEKAKEVLEAAGIEVTAIHPVVIQKLRQDVPGQLGSISRYMAENGVNIEVQYSDHANRLILVVDNYEKGKTVAQNWNGNKSG